MSTKLKSSRHIWQVRQIKTLLDFLLNFQSGSDDLWPFVGWESQLPASEYRCSLMSLNPCRLHSFTMPIYPSVIGKCTPTTCCILLSVFGVTSACVLSRA